MRRFWLSKWFLGLKTVSTADLAVLMSSVGLFLGIYELRRHSKAKTNGNGHSNDSGR